MQKFLFVLVFGLISGSTFAQCGVTSGFQPVSSGQIGSAFDADVNVTAGWNIYKYEWERNGTSIPGNFAYISNEGYGYDNVCLTVKATNPSTGDSCESQYCQIVFSAFPLPNPMYIDATPAGGLTMSFFGGYCSNYNGGNPSFQLDFGDGNIASTNYTDHTYADTGTYLVKFTYWDITTFPLDVTRKVYVGNGHTNFDINPAAMGNTTCFSALTAFSSNPPYFGGYATDYSPFAVTQTSPISSGNYVPIDYYGTGIGLIEYTASDSLGNTIGTCQMVAIPDCKVAPDTVSGAVWKDDDADGLWDAGENAFTGPVDLKIEDGFYIENTDSTGNYSIPVPQAPIAVRIEDLPQNYITTFPSSNGHYCFFTNSTNHSGYNFGVIDKGVNICGKTFIDINGNNVFDSGTDIIYKNVMVRVHNTILNRTFSVQSDLAGNYCIAVPVGNYILKGYGNNLDSAYAVPDSIIINSPTAGNFNNNDFAFQTPVQGGNLGIFLSPGGMPRPGFNYSLSATVINTGVSNSAGAVVISYAPNLIYVSSSPAGVHNATNKTVTWQSGVITPTTSKNYTANFTVPVSTPLGSVLTSNATVTTDVSYTDYNLTNNTSAVSSTVIGSFDPNDKLVTPQGVGAAANVLHSDRLYYRVNFQNTGTAEAINIIVQDEIDPNLDMNTFRMERASDSYSLVIIGNTVTWRFFNIMLPDSNSNEPDSHGFIEFSIKAIQGLPDGTVISNDADIYFDFNPAIVTNIVSNTLQTSLTGISENEMELNFEVYPNPFKNELLIKSTDTKEKVRKILVYDVYGKEIFGLTIPESVDGLIEIPLPHFASGVYFVKIESGSGIAVKKLLRQN